MLILLVAGWGGASALPHFFVLYLTPQRPGATPGDPDPGDARRKRRKAQVDFSPGIVIMKY